MVRRLGLGKNNHLTYASLALNPRNIKNRNINIHQRGKVANKKNNVSFYYCFSHFIKLSKELIEFRFFRWAGKLFHTTGPEYIIRLNISLLDLCGIKFEVTEDLKNMVFSSMIL